MGMITESSLRALGLVFLLLVLLRGDDSLAKGAKVPALSHAQQKELTAAVRNTLMRVYLPLVGDASSGRAGGGRIALQRK
jgi:hypothetical protein